MKGKGGFLGAAMVWFEGSILAGGVKVRKRAIGSIRPRCGWWMQSMLPLAATLKRRCERDLGAGGLLSKSELVKTPFFGNVAVRIVTPTFFTQSLGLESVAMIDVS